MRSKNGLVSLVGALFLVGCGGGDGGADIDGGGGGPDAASGQIDAGGEVWTPLIAGAWSLAPGEDFPCVTTTLTRDIFVGGIRPIAPQGTHHTVLLDSGNCAGGVTNGVLYASGVGTGELRMPAGVGLKFRAGQTISLDLHLFNTGLTTLTGTSGIEVLEIAESEIVNEAEVFLPGPLDLNLPAGQVKTESGTCTLNRNQTLFAIFPHMHQLGTHMTVTANPAGAASVTLSDDDYDFFDQAFSPIPLIALKAGDTIDIDCTYNNTTGSTVNWGNSSTQEMCFAIFYRFPASSELAFCTN